LLLYLALCIADGAKFLHWLTRKGKVLYINFELQPAFVKERIEVLKKRLKIETTDNLVIWNLRGRTADFEALIQNIIKETEGNGYSLIILDPIYKAMVGKGENMGTSVGVLCNQLERLAERSGAAVVYSHHFPKGDPKKKAVIDRMAGSGEFARDADTILVLTEHETASCYCMVKMSVNNQATQSL